MTEPTRRRSRKATTPSLPIDQTPMEMAEVPNPPNGDRPHADSCGGLNQQIEGKRREAISLDDFIRQQALLPGATIHARLRAVRLDVGHIGKDKRNNGQGAGYAFRGIDDALNHVGPMMVRYGVTVEIEVEECELTREVVELQSGKERVDSHAKLRLRVRFTCDPPHGAEAEDLHLYRVTQVTYGEGLDFGSDKAINKATSAAFKYAIFLGFCLPVAPEALQDSDHDGKQEERDRSRPGTNQQRRQGRTQDGPPPMKLCPECGKQAVITSKPEFGGGFVCYKAKGGCGARFDTEADLTPQGGQTEVSQDHKPAEQPAKPVDPEKTKFWRYCQSLRIEPADAAALWERWWNTPDRAALAAWCVANNVDEETEDAAWTQYGSAEAAINAMREMVDATGSSTPAT